MPNPFASQLSETPQDPFALKAFHKWHPVRVIWTLQSRALEMASASTHKSINQVVQQRAMAHFTSDRGTELADTAVTSGQLALLEAGVRETEGLAGDIAEIGAYRGVTTLKMAQLTARTVHAIDPFIGYGGAETDMALFQQRTRLQGNIVHHRITSGGGSELFGPDSLSFVFVDAVHDVSNSWFDSVQWSRRIMPGGILAMHDVDDHHGPNLTARRFLQRQSAFRAWAWCPNILLLRREP